MQAAASAPAVWWGNAIVGHWLVVLLVCFTACMDEWMGGGNSSIMLHHHHRQQQQQPRWRW